MNAKSISFSPGFNRVSQVAFKVRTVSTVSNSWSEKQTVETVFGNQRGPWSPG